MDEPTERLAGRAASEKTRVSFDGWPVDGRLSVGPVEDPEATGGYAPEDPAGPSRPRFGDYELGRELGRGGMGVVHEARHVGLNRPVALKMMRSGVLAGDAELQRFRIEAEALALLDHPRIVPVYEVGEADGQGYLAMKLVAGGNLADRLGDYRDDPRAAAEMTAEIADAVHHAHSRGILHRDLKPANILVDADGHPLVTDFGLAKRFNDDSAMTVTGAVLGTPAFMSPEQAAGRRAAVTTATDVYGLGTILYSMLTGRPPFLGEDVMEVLDALRALPPERPSRRNAAVPRDLDTIVLKCLEKDPRRRYATAHALAEDLRAWLDSRPIAARRVGPAERAWLLCRRKPAVAALAAAALLATFGGASAVLVVQARANADLRDSNDRERRQFGLAMDAVCGMRRKVADDPSLREPRFYALRSGLLGEAADFYGRLEELLGGREDPASLSVLADAYDELGELTEQTGSTARALEIYSKALAIRTSAPPRGGEDSLALARTLVAVGRLRSGMGQAEASTSALGEAIRRAAGESAEALDVRASALEELARQGVPASRPEEARASYNEALAIRRRAVARAPGRVEFLERLASLAESFGEFEMLTRRPREAAALLDEAEALLGKLAVSRPDDVDFWIDLAGNLMRQGALCGHFLGRPREALPDVEEARRILAKLAAEDPSLVRPRQKLAECEAWLFLAYWNLGRLESAREVADAMAATADALLLLDPGTAANRSHAASAVTARALVLSRSGRHAEALPLFQRAAEESEAIAADTPSYSGFRFAIISALANVANELRLLGRSREALPIAERAAATAEEFLRDRESLLLVQMHLGEALRQLAEVRSACGDPAGAAAAARRAIEILAEPPPEVLQTFYEQAAALAVLAGLAGVPGSGVSPDEGPPAAHAAVAALREVYDLGFRNTTVIGAETAFDPIRDRPDFRAIFASMVDLPDDPFAP